MRVLVTGGTGFVGSHSVAALLEAGHAVRLLVRSPDRVEAALRPLRVDPARVEVLVGDVTDAAAVRRAVEGMEGVLHAASVFALGGRRRAEMLSVNVAGTRTVLEAGLAAGCNPVVHVSSLVALVGGPNRGRTLTADSELGQPVGTYLTTKRDSDQLARALQAQDRPVIITYPGSVWGPEDPHLGESCQMALQMAGGRMPATSRGGFGVVDVRDLAVLHARAMKPHPGPRRYPAFGHHVRHTDLHRLVCEAAGVKRLNLASPASSLRGLLPLLWATERLGLALPVTRDGAWLTICDHQVDSSVSERELGVRFRPVAEAVRDTVAWLQARGLLAS